MNTSRSPVTHDLTRCTHCGESCNDSTVLLEDKPFCCAGCRSVYEILQTNDLCAYYERAEMGGVSMKPTRTTPSKDNLAVLDDKSVATEFLSFTSASRNRVIWTVPTLHCPSCVWLLEQLDRLDAGVLASEVDIMRKSVTIDYDPRVTSLRAVAETMSSVGYEPLIRLEGTTPASHQSTRRLYARIGVAGFAAANTMLMYFSQYFAGAEGIGRSLNSLFGILSIVLSIPVLAFSASPWFSAARTAIVQRRVNLDVPVALGILALFVRSLVDILAGHGEGYLDSFSGLVLFLLVGRLFQQKAFDALSFDRTYRSFFPLSVRKLHVDGSLQVIPIDHVEVGDTLVVRNGEVVPCDSELRSQVGYVDYSFVTGEAVPVESLKGSTVYAGGRVVGRALEFVASKSVSHSELAAMWDRTSTSTPRNTLVTLSDGFGRWFTVVALLLAIGGGVVWLPNIWMAFNVFTAVLIIACPCALTLATPITLGTALGLLGRFGIYLRNVGVLLELTNVTTVCFDKTGTLTEATHSVSYEGRPLTPTEWRAVRSLAQHSTHPVSRAIAGDEEHNPETPRDMHEEPGAGILGHVAGLSIAIGSPRFATQLTGHNVPEHSEAAAILVIDNQYVGTFLLRPRVRRGIAEMVAALRAKYALVLISGDSRRDATLLAPLFGQSMSFDCRPEQKIDEIARLQARGATVLMVGDGLNDAGALATADVAIAVTDDTATLVPACDIILRAGSLPRLPRLLRYARQMRTVILLNFLLSVLYNIGGLTLALLGHLTPLAAAILMPVSSLTVIAISVLGARWFARGFRTEVQWV